MKLVRFGPRNEERPGVLLDDQTILDVRAMAFDIEDYNAHFFATSGMERVRALLSERNRKTVDAGKVRIACPVATPQKIICLGKNYVDHAKEFDSEVPEVPVLFGKAVSAINGPFDPIVLPPAAVTCDVEAELAVVIGRRARRVAEEDVLDHIAGYTVLNDVTDRDAQRIGKQWFRGKGVDTFCPIGPFLVTPDEAGDPHNLTLYSKVNGRTLQQSNTGHMIFKIPHVISFITRTITLEPGDIIATGTPGGIGSAQHPPVLLHPGDNVEIGVEKIGVQKNRVERDGEAEV